MTSKKLKTKMKNLSTIRQDAALKRWKGHKKIEYTTIRIKKIIKNQIDKMPGKSVSDKIEKLINK